MPHATLYTLTINLIKVWRNKYENNMIDVFFLFALDILLLLLSN